MHLHIPHLDMTKQHIGWSSGRVATKEPNVTSTVGPVTRTGDVLLIDIHVDSPAACNDRQQVDLIQPCLDEGRGPFVQHRVMGSGIVYRSHERIGSRAIDEEGIILRLRVITAEHHAAKIPFGHGHLNLVGQIAKLGGLSHTQCIRILRLCDGMIGPTSELTTEFPVPGSILAPIVGAIGL
jgi:hypothetical protein